MALAVGMKAIQFSGTEMNREDLIAAGLDAELPLPKLKRSVSAVLCDTCSGWKTKLDCFNRTLMKEAGRGS